MIREALGPARESDRFSPDLAAGVAAIPPLPAGADVRDLLGRSLSSGSLSLGSLSSFLSQGLTSKLVVGFSGGTHRPGGSFLWGV